MKEELASPNFNERDSAVALEYIVLHYTGMENAKSALARLVDPEAKVSAHYVIGEDGHIWHLVDEAKRAWHAGDSFWRGCRDMNSASIGIELVNPGHEFGYRPFPEVQITALKILLREIALRRKLNLSTAILGHSDIAVARKQDPGELFPWKALAAEGIGIWPAGLTQAPEGLNNETEAGEMLASIGYDTRDFAAALLAFQRRFFPERLTGKTDPETLLKIASVKRLLAA